MTEIQREILYADKPLYDPQHDSLGYGPFAEQSADSFCGCRPRAWWWPFAAIGDGQVHRFEFCGALSRPAPGWQHSPHCSSFQSLVVYRPRGSHPAVLRQHRPGPPWIRISRKDFSPYSGIPPRNSLMRSGFVRSTQEPLGFL